MLLYGNTGYYGLLQYTSRYYRFLQVTIFYNRLLQVITYLTVFFKFCFNHLPRVLFRRIPCYYQLHSMSMYYGWGEDWVAVTTGRDIIRKWQFWRELIMWYLLFKLWKYKKNQIQCDIEVYLQPRNLMKSS